MGKWRKYLIGSWSWKRPFYSLASIYVILLIIVIFFANHLIFQPPSPYYTASQPDLISIENDKKQKVACIYLKGDPDKPTILWSHGNAEDIGSSYPLLQHLCKTQGYSILAYDYPGYGLSEGSPNEKGCYSNIQAAWEHLTKTLGTPEGRIFILGQSVGSGPSTWLAEKEKAAGLILISPFKSTNSVPFRVNIFPIDYFSNIDRIKNVDEPLLIMHGDNDKVIHQSHSKALIEAHTGDKTFIDIKGAGHNTILGKQLLWDSLEKFIRTH